MPAGLVVRHQERPSEEGYRIVESEISFLIFYVVLSQQLVELSEFLVLPLQLDHHSLCLSHSTRTHQAASKVFS